MTGAHATVQIIPVPGIPEIRPGDNAGARVADAIRAALGKLESGDVVVVTHKLVSKAEGALADLTKVVPSQFAVAYASEWGKDARQVEVVLQQAKRVIRMVRGLIIAETHHGFICANAGVDASNAAEDIVVLLPVDPDQSARGILETLMSSGLADIPSAADKVGVIITDSFGRPWRNGIVNVAIGTAGIAPLADYRGKFDPNGYELRASVMAVADEIAAASELVMHKLAAIPVAVVRGYEWQTEDAPGSGRDLIMAEERNLFI